MEVLIAWRGCYREEEPPMFMMTYEVRVWAVRLETWLAAAGAHLTLASLRPDTSRHVSSDLDIQHYLHPTSQDNIVKSGTDSVGWVSF